jgi:hypothetical protein
LRARAEGAPSVVIGSGPLVAKPVCCWCRCAGAEVVLARVAEAVLDARTELAGGFGFFVGQRACRPPDSVPVHTHHATPIVLEGGLILGTTVVATAIIEILDGFGCFWAGNKKARYLIR